jgi:nuclear transport factor 2 (NTF2) superfamily protein
LKACRDLPDTAADRICRVDAPSLICHTVVPSERQGQDMTTDQSIRELTFIDAEAVLGRAQRLLNAGDISEVMKTFASDVVVRFADFPETYGRPPLEAFLRARFARQRNYRLQKQLRAVSGNVIVCYWDAEWEDGQNGHKMEGRGIELLTMRADEIAKWEATFNVWRKGDAPSLPIV